MQPLKGNPMTQAKQAPKTAMQRVLDMVERVGNKVPHPVIIFLTLIAIVVGLSHVLFLTGARVSYEAIVPEAGGLAATESAEAGIYDNASLVGYQPLDESKYHIETRTVATRSLLTIDG